MTDNRYGQFTYGGGYYGQRGGKTIERITDNRYGQFTYGGGNYGQRGGKTITRTTGISGDGSIATSRGGIEKLRTTGITATGEIEITRNGIEKHRTSGIEGNVEIETEKESLQLFREVESHAGQVSSFVYNNRTSLEMVDYQINWDKDNATWYTNWFQETRITGDEDNLALRAKVVEGSKEPVAKVQVQYDRNGDGIPDEETRIIDIGKAEDLHQIDDIPISESGQYRLKIMDYSGFNSLISIDFGIVH